MNTFKVIFEMIDQQSKNQITHDELVEDLSKKYLSNI